MRKTKQPERTETRPQSVPAETLAEVRGGNVYKLTSDKSESNADQIK